MRTIQVCLLDEICSQTLLIETAYCITHLKCRMGANMLSADALKAKNLPASEKLTTTNSMKRAHFSHKSPETAYFLIILKPHLRTMTTIQCMCHLFSNYTELIVFSETILMCE